MKIFEIVFVLVVGLIAIGSFIAGYKLARMDAERRQERPQGTLDKGGPCIECGAQTELRCKRCGCPCCCDDYCYRCFGQSEPLPQKEIASAEFPDDPWKGCATCEDMEDHPNGSLFCGSSEGPYAGHFCTVDFCCRDWRSCQLQD